MPLMPGKHQALLTHWYLLVLRHHQCHVTATTDRGVGVEVPAVVTTHSTTPPPTQTTTLNVSGCW
jgi:hypothetical protein